MPSARAFYRAVFLHSGNGIWNMFCIFRSSVITYEFVKIWLMVTNRRVLHTSWQPQLGALLCLWTLLVLQIGDKQSTYSPVKYRPWKCCLVAVLVSELKRVSYYRTHTAAPIKVSNSNNKVSWRQCRAMPSTHTLWLHILMMTAK